MHKQIQLFTFFTGYRLFKLVLFLVGFLVVFCFTCVLCQEYLTEKLYGRSFEYRHQIFLGISAAVGLIAGLLTVCIFYVGLFALGATMGWFVGLAFLPLFYKHSEYLSEHNWLPYIILCAFAIAGGILILCIQKVIIVSIVIHPSLEPFGVSMVLITMWKMAECFTTQSVFCMSALPHCWYTWVVIGLIPVMFIAGLVVQFCKTAKNSDHREAYGRSSRNLYTATPMQEFSDQRPILTDYD